METNRARMVQSGPEWAITPENINTPNAFFCPNRSPMKANVYSDVTWISTPFRLGLLDFTPRPSSPPLPPWPNTHLSPTAQAQSLPNSPTPLPLYQTAPPSTFQSRAAPHGLGLAGANYSSRFSVPGRLPATSGANYPSHFSVPGSLPATFQSQAASQ